MTTMMIAIFLPGFLICLAFAIWITKQLDDGVKGAAREFGDDYDIIVDGLGIPTLIPKAPKSTK